MELPNPFTLILENDMRIRREVSEIPLTKEQMDQARAMQQRYIASSKHISVPTQTNVPIDLNPAWKMQGNYELEQSRKRDAVSTFGQEMMNATIHNNLQDAIDKQNAIKAQREAEEDAIIPPSLEEMGGVPKDLDEYISFVEEQTVLNGVDLVATDDKVITNPVAIVQPKAIKAATSALTEDALYAKTLKALKQEYKRM